MSKQELDVEDEKDESEEEEKVETKEDASDEKDESSEEKPDEDSEEKSDEDSDVKDEGTSKENAPSEDEDEFVTLPDGTKVTHQELLSGYMKDSDYRKKTSELARQRESYQAKPTEQEQDNRPNPVLSKYDSKQIEEFKILAKELGFVAKDDLTQMEAAKTKQETINSFYVQHPEYAKENDPTDVRYTALVEEL